MHYHSQIYVHLKCKPPKEELHQHVILKVHVESCVKINELQCAQGVLMCLLVRMASALESQSMVHQAQNLMRMSVGRSAHGAPYAMPGGFLAMSSVFLAAYVI